MDQITLVGTLASIFTACSLLPQLVKLIRKKKAEDVSLLMLIVLFIGLGFWIWYGFLKKDWIIIVSNAFSLAINLSVCVLSIRYKNK